MSPKESTERNQQGNVPIRISVHDASGHLLEGPARVELVREEETIRLSRSTNSLFYEGTVAPGRYRLRASSEDMVAPERSLEIGEEEETVPVYLGEENWPHYRLGEHPVPFPPPGDLIALAFPNRTPAPEEVESLTAQITRRLPLESCPIDEARDEQRTGKRQGPRGEEKDEEGFRVADGAVWLFRFTTEASPKLRQEANEVVRELIGDTVRVGIPVDLHPNQVKVIDNRFVVRFREDTEKNRIDALVEKESGRLLRDFIQAPNTYLVELPAGNFRQNLATVEDWREKGLLVYGEPDIMAEFVDDQFPASPPNDPTYSNQDNLTLQNVDDAWQTLNDLDADLTLGNPEVHVATLDRGVDLNHPDINDDLTDGTEQIARCFDFSGMRECTVAGYTPDTDHGMGVYGIIAAHTDNGEAVAGIAPNTHQIALERPNLTSSDYPDVLCWAAGFTTGNSDPDWPDEPLDPGADIISCSHGSSGLALSGIMDNTFQTLAQGGRDGQGTIVVYSAGNSDSLITGFRTWAAHSDTLAIANSLQPDTNGVETKANSSNFGPEIDLCAQGTGAPSLDASGGEQNFGGTSAAAPTVAAVAALILSVIPSLTFDGIRDILRDTAVKIDPNNSDSTGRWEDENGRTSNDAGYTGPHFSQFYGYGRVDADAAVSQPSGCIGALADLFSSIFGSS